MSTESSPLSANTSSAASTACAKNQVVAVGTMIATDPVLPPASRAAADDAR
ncbi:hypothetical protein QFZ52_001646 [Arthrobacter woluwensis]|uniref:hypothetical protein n=1 Tax=Arthrobacter woluwensis TaxID=156980 RepID=UPI00277FFF28|nr:hypothetical protein [Arthrobacter woluwensis]MDQ0708994.1 hypothetical protein [Arthrobacter woluwensis]